MADPTDDDGRDARSAALAGLSAEERRLFERFAAILATAGPPAVPLLRVQRLEVVDGEGRLLVVIGDIGGGRLEQAGIAVYDQQPSERATLAVDECGPSLSFSLRGDDALVIGVDDPETHAMHPGPFLELLSRDGEVARGWRVDDETGAVHSERADEAPAPGEPASDEPAPDQ